MHLANVEHAQRRPESSSRTSATSLGECVDRRLRAPGSREAIALALTQVVEDAFLFDVCSGLPNLRGSLDEPISIASEVALETLIDELQDLLDRLPDAASEAWDRARIAADLGTE